MSALAACDQVSHEPQAQLPTYPATGSPTGRPTATAPTPTPDATTQPPGLQVVNQVQIQVQELAIGLPAPWGIAVLPDATVLLTLRDQAQLVVVDSAALRLLVGEGQSLTEAEDPNAPAVITQVTGPGAQFLKQTTTTAGEGGLLAVALAPGYRNGGQIYLYRTTTREGEILNQVWRGQLRDAQLGELTLVVDDIPGAQVHNGGGLGFGPDGQLYIGTGDAKTSPMAQNPDSTSGKILRVQLDGSPAPGNPIPDNPLWSLGHRNVQGFGWDPWGRMFASEFGQNSFDELNLIVPGQNYGWPKVEGVPAGDAASWSATPLQTWTPAQASPSGLALTNEGIYLAGLRGQTLWRVGLGNLTATPQPVLQGYGRLRAVTALPTGDLLVLTNNTDGRGEPTKADDRLLLLRVKPLD